MLDARCWMLGRERRFTTKNTKCTKAQSKKVETPSVSFVHFVFFVVNLLSLPSIQHLASSISIHRQMRFRGRAQIE